MTISEIATVAEVSASTIYALFTSKQGILRVLLDEAFPTESFQALVDAVYAEPTAEGRLKLSAKIARQLYDAERELMELFREAAALTTDFKSLEKEREERRYQRQAVSLEEMAEKGMLAPGLSYSQARDILWAFTGRDLYRLLVVERGWSSDEYEAWLAQQLIDSLLKPSH